MLSRKKKEQFSVLYDRHYRRLYNYAYKVLREKEIAEELVQESFIKLWQKIDSISKVERSIESYLITVLKNKIIDHHRKNNTKNKHLNLYALNRDSQQEMNHEWELSEQIQSIYASMNQKTLEIFRLSREQGLSYKEIASQKNISIKTVELHISKALSIFREQLKNYL